jgi:hypothetical protein
MKGGFVVQPIFKDTAPVFYSVEDIGRLLGIGRNSAYRLANGKDFPAIHVGNRIVVPADLFQKWASQQATRGKGGGANGKFPQG